MAYDWDFVFIIAENILVIKFYTATFRSNLRAIGKPFYERNET